MNIWPFALILGMFLQSPAPEPSDVSIEQIYQDELRIAIKNVPGATMESRNKFKKKAERLAKDLLLKGQKRYKLPQLEVKIFWDDEEVLEIAHSVVEENKLSIHLNEVLFFALYKDHLNLVIPHEVAHLINNQIFSIPTGRDQSFLWVLQVLAPNYVEKDLDPAPACRILRRIYRLNGVVSYSSECGVLP